jgi:hypothetical protein
MKRDLAFIRYFAILLAVLYVLADGHLLCEHFHCVHSDSHSEHDCGRDCSQPMPEEHDDPCNHECNNGERPVVLVQRNVEESVDLLKNLSVGFTFVCSMEVPAENVGFRDVVTACPSASSLRLHLLYRSLLI